MLLVARALEKFARFLCAAGVAVMGAMMMVTVADVILRSVIDFPIFGTFDLVELCLVTMIFLALPETFRREQHVAVELVDYFSKPWIIDFLRIFGLVLAAVFLAITFWQGILPAYDTYRFGEQTLELGLPRYLHWLPILVGTLVSLLVVIVVLSRRIRSRLAKRSRT